MIAYLFLFFLALVSAAYAGEPENLAPPQTQQNILYCPPINTLHKDPDTRLWSATQGWKSYDLSFVDKITSFAGAQWRGTNVGQIFCVYRGSNATDFPVLLAYRVMAYAPQGGLWSANLGGYQNCESHNQVDCPFSIRVQPPVEDLYEQAEKLKQSAPVSTRPGF